MQSTLAKLSLCRTPALGGHVYECGTCDHRAVVHNSCGDRHCPQCSGAKRRDWLDSSAKLLLPGITYYQVVFTIPDKLSSLTLGNRQVMFNLLFGSAWRALKQTLQDEQQFEAAAAMVLHTWNQHLDAHIHVHALVPGGGPSLNNPGHWKTARPPAHEAQHRFWLVDADALRLAFRTAFLAGLRRLHARGELKLDGEWSSLQDAAAFEDWLQSFENMKWVTYIQAPPTPDTTPDQVLKYLARYMTGGPISDRRLVRHERGHVTFRARKGTQVGGDADDVEEVTLPGAEFVRRWAMHILPKGYVKTRRFGGYSNHHRERYLTECRERLPAARVEARTGHEAGLDSQSDSDAEPTTTEPTIVETSSANEPSASDDSSEADEHQGPICAECGEPLLCLAATDRPGWSVLMHSPARPRWYDDG